MLVGINVVGLFGIGSFGGSIGVRGLVKVFGKEGCKRSFFAVEGFGRGLWQEMS